MFPLRFRREVKEAIEYNNLVFDVDQIVKTEKYSITYYYDKSNVKKILVFAIHNEEEDRSDLNIEIISKTKYCTEKYLCYNIIKHLYQLGYTIYLNATYPSLMYYIQNGFRISYDHFHDYNKMYDVPMIFDPEFKRYNYIDQRTFSENFKLVYNDMNDDLRIQILEYYTQFIERFTYLLKYKEIDYKNEESYCLINYIDLNKIKFKYLNIYENDKSFYARLCKGQGRGKWTKGERIMKENKYDHGRNLCLIESNITGLKMLNKYDKSILSDERLRLLTFYLEKRKSYFI